MSEPRLIAISDLSVCAEELLLQRLEALARAATPGSVALLLRDYAATGQTRLRVGQRLRHIARASGQALWVADRLDLALLLEADALHLGEGSVSAAAARRALPSTTRISRAFHPGTTPETELHGVDALLVSPVLAPRKGRPALGLAALGAWGEQLRARHQAYPLTTYALGGVTRDNAAACLGAGADGVAAIGAALAAEPEPLLAALGILA